MVENKFKNYPSISLSINLLIAIYENNEQVQLKNLQLESRRLPWIGEEKDICEAISKVVNNLLSSKDKTSFDSIRKETAYCISELLKRDEIDVAPEIKIICEEHSEKVADKISKPKTKQTWLLIRLYQDILANKSCEIKKTDLIIDKNVELKLELDIERNKLELPIKLKEIAFLQKIHISIDNEIIAKKEVNKNLKQGKQIIDLPIPPLSLYYKLKSKSSTIHLFFGQKNKEIIINNISIKVVRLKAPPLNLFIDMGSTRSKMAVIRAGNCNPFNKNELISWIDNLNEPNFAKKTIASARFFNPTPTNDFLEYYGLPKIGKQALTQLNDDEIALWLGQAAERFGVYYSEQKKVVANIYWSFPAVLFKSRDFNYISKKATEIASHGIIGHIHFVPEHEALKWRFEKTMQQIAKIGKYKKNERAKIIKKNLQTEKERNEKLTKYNNKKDEYKNKFFIKRLFLSKPIKPDVSNYIQETVQNIETFYRNFMKINADQGLQEYIILDAGGFTLDVFGKISKKTFGRSFEVGGDYLTQHIKEYLSKSRGESISYKRAEAEKKELCESRSKVTKGETSEKCKEITWQIYENAVDEIVKWLKTTRETAFEIPLLLTGGAMYNDFLRELIEDKFSKTNGINIQFIAFDSVAISKIINKYPELKEQGLQRFYLTTSGFNNLKLDIAYDVAAGLIEYANNN